MSRCAFVAGAILLLAIPVLGTGPSAAFEVFQSTANTAADRAQGAVPNGGAAANLNIWIDTKEGGVGNANPGNPALACSGPGSTGDYSCSWGLQFTATPGMTITGFTPQQGGDYIVMFPTTFPTQTLKMNGGKPAGPVYELDELRIGTLQVQATGPTGQLLLSSGSSVNTLLIEEDITGPPKVLAGVCGASTTDTDCDAIQAPTDNCPSYATASLTDTDSDGRGNACECTDQNGDGRNTVQDLIAINSAIFNPGQITPLCDGNNDGLCNVNDIIAANIEIFSPTSTSTCARQPVPGP